MKTLDRVHTVSSSLLAGLLAIAGCAAEGDSSNADKDDHKGGAHEPFYANKAIKVKVGFSPNGAQVKYVKLLTDHMTEHIPGSPAFVIETRQNANVTSWSSYEAALEFADAPSDGLELANLLPELALQQAFAPELYGDFDMGALEYIGAINSKGPPTCFIRAGAGFGTTWEEIRAAVPGPHMGWVGKGNTGYDMTVFLRQLGASFRVEDDATLHGGIKAVTDGVKAGTYDGVCWPTGTLKRELAAEIASGAVVPFVTTSQVTEFPGVPTLQDLSVGTDVERLVQVWEPTYEMLITLAAPPGTDAEKVEILRDAFAATLADPDFAAAAEASKMPFAPVSAADTTAAIAALLGLSDEDKALAREILGDD
jgi:hypothetical protein